MHLNNRCSNAKRKEKNICSTIVESTPLKGAYAPNVIQL